MRTRTRTTALLLGLCLLACPTAAVAQPAGAIVALHYENHGRYPVVGAVSDRGIVFIGSDFQTHRSYAARAQTGRPWFWFTDMDNQPGNEFVFGGDPSFVLGPAGNPLFGVTHGCDDFYVGNMIGDAASEVFCRHGSTLTMWNYDGQFLWEYSVTGMRISTCLADDVDDDNKLEFGCQAGSHWLLVDPERDDPVQEVDDNPTNATMEDPAPGWVQDAQSALQGDTTYDLTGSGDASDTLHWNAGTLTMLAGDGRTLGTVSLPESDLYSVEVADLNGDHTPEVFLGGVGHVYVVSPSGQLLSTVDANPGDLHREIQVTVESVGANGLSDSSEEAAHSAVDGGMSSIERCYRNSIGNDPFIRVGEMFYQLTVDGRGHVTEHQKIHSDVNNHDLETCVEHALDDLRFSGAAEGTGTVSLRLGFDFVDR